MMKSSEVKEIPKKKRVNLSTNRIKNRLRNPKVSFGTIGNRKKPQLTYT